MHKQLLFIFIVVISFATLKVSAQCPTATVPDTVCVGEPFDITNTTTGFESYFWDFCTGDLNNTPSGSNIGNPGGLLTTPHQIHIVEDSGNFYGFVANFGSHNILRLDYGNSPSNIPTVITLGPFTTLDGPTGIQIHKENNIWYALVSNYLSGNLVRIEFGTSITNTNFIETSLGNSGFNTPFYIKLIKQNNFLFAFIANNLGNNIAIVEFGTSITNIPLISILGGSFSGPFGIDIVYDCFSDKFVGFISNLNSTFLTILDFGNTISSSPTLSLLTGLPIQSSSAIQILNENNEWHILLTDEINNSFTHLNSGNDLLNSNPLVIYYGQFGGLTTPRGLYFINHNSQWNGTLVNYSNSITLSEYSNDCSANIATSTAINPAGNFFSEDGIKSINLKASDADGNIYYFTEDIYVREIPEANFTFSNLPCDNFFSFEDSSFFNGGSIISWFWDFGEGNTSNLENPTHTFSLPGNYSVKLTVTASNGCTGTIQKNIFNEKPVASFSAVDGCVIPPMQFINTSPDTQNVINSFFWDFGDGNTSNLENPLHTYLNPGTYNVLFAASIGTCSDTVTSNITYEPKPDVKFSVINTCLNQQQEFINSTTIASGTITSYSWNFDDGNLSNLVNPLHQYADTGYYEVELIATGSNGCIDTLKKEIRVSIQPDADFNFSPQTLCSNSSVIFQDISNTIGDTVNNWIWTFGTGDSALIANPAYSFINAGQYPVTLTIMVGTNCIDSVTQNIQVEPSPVVAFSSNTACFGDSTFFTDLSTTTAGNLTSWNWNFGTGNSSTLQNPVYLFPSEGNYMVSLSVGSDIGCMSIDTISVTVAPIPHTEFTVSNACSDQTAQFIDSSSISLGLITGWSWNFGDPASGINNTSVSQNPVHNYSSAGTYPVSLEVVSDNGCIDVLNKTILVSKTPYANFSASQACDGEFVSFTYIDNSIPSNATNWFWNFGNGATSTNDDPATLYLTWGTYSVTLVVADSSSGCSDTTIKLIDVDPNPVAVIPPLIPCIGTPFMFSDSSYIASGTIQNWQWNINGINYPEHNPIINFNDTLNYLVSLEVTSDQGCIAQVSDSIFVSGLPTADFTFSPIFGDAPLNVNFLNQSIDGSTYEWNFGDGTLSNSISPSHTYSDTGNFNITLIAFNKFGCIDSTAKTIYIIQPRLDLAVMKVFPVTDKNFISLSAEIINFGTREVNSFFISAYIGGNPSIQEYWTGSLKSGETMLYSFNASIELIENLNFFCVLVSNPNGEPDINLSNNEKCVSFSDLVEIFSIYPNPSSDLFSIQFSLPSTINIQIDLFDSIGKIVKNLYNGVGVKGYNSISFSSKAEGITNGVYMIKISTNEDSIIAKFIRY